MDKKTIKTITSQRIVTNLLDTIVKELAEIKERLDFLEKPTLSQERRYKVQREARE